MCLRANKTIPRCQEAADSHHDDGTTVAESRNVFSRVRFAAGKYAPSAKVAQRSSSCLMLQPCSPLGKRGNPRSQPWYLSIDGYLVMTATIVNQRPTYTPSSNPLSCVLGHAYVYENFEKRVIPTPWPMRCRKGFNSEAWLESFKLCQCACSALWATRSRTLDAGHLVTS